MAAQNLEVDVAALNLAIRTSAVRNLSAESEYKKRSIYKYICMFMIKMYYSNCIYIYMYVKQANCARSSYIISYYRQAPRMSRVMVETGIPTFDLKKKSQL